jgi:hypothetical protein
VRGIVPDKSVPTIWLLSLKPKAML